MKRTFIILAVIVLLLAVLGGAAAGYVYHINRSSNALNAKTIGDIRLPIGYERIAAKDGSFAAYLRSLPLRKKDTPVYLYNSNKKANYQWLSSGVVDLPLLSNDEQCADVCMRLYAEYMFAAGKYSDICFTALNGNKMRYTGGNNRQAFEKYMRSVYGYCNTTSLTRSLPTRPLFEMQIGDVFVYGHHKVAGKSRYGHAVMVADMAVNKRTGKKLFLLVEGNTPARDIHILRHPNPFNNTWFTLDPDAETLRLLCFRFKNEHLRHF